MEHILCCSAAALAGVTTSSKRDRVRLSSVALFIRVPSRLLRAPRQRAYWQQFVRRLPCAPSSFAQRHLLWVFSRTRTFPRNLTHNQPPALRPPCLSSASMPACPGTAVIRPTPPALASTTPLPASVEGQPMTTCRLRCCGQLISVSAHTFVQHRLRRHSPGPWRCAR